MNTSFLLGSTVDHTPAFSKKTLFVTGNQTIESIDKQANVHNVQHISFSSTGMIPKKEIEYFLTKGYWVTLEYMSTNHYMVIRVLGEAIFKHRLFVPLINVAIPYIENAGPNFTIKIGDIGVNKTNRGTWSTHYTEITDSNKFTDWKEYPGDTDIDFDEATKGPVTEDITFKPNEVLLNNSELGIDSKSESALKPEVVDDINKVDVSKLTTLEAVAKAYIK